VPTLQGDLAELPKTWMEGKPENVRIFKHLPQNAARMLRSDLKAAGHNGFRKLQTTRNGQSGQNRISCDIAIPLARWSISTPPYARLHDLQGAINSLPGYEQPPGVGPENEVLRATGTDGTKTYESKGAQHLAQQIGRETVPFSAKPGEKIAACSAENESPDASQVEAPGDIVRASATTDDQRRRWESNPRWRICNPLP
jgi:hypothetical protein